MHVIGLLLAWLAVGAAIAPIAGMAIGLQRAIPQNILTTAASATAATGNAYALPQGWSDGDAIEWQYTITNGTFSALTVTLSLSEDGVNWQQVVSDTSFTNGKMGIILDPSGKFPMRGSFIQAAISGGTVGTGTPVVAVNIRVR